MEIIIDETFQNDMEFGFIYCFSNECMPGILKIGITDKNPLERARQLYTTGVALPFKVEVAKKVKDPRGKETILHKLLEQYADRVNDRREFFRVTTEEVLTFFELMDGEMWVDETCDKQDEEDEPTPQTNKTNVKGCRDMTKCFVNGQRIRHKIGINKIWIGEYDASKNVIVYDGKYYNSPSGFATAHHAIDNPIRTTANGWGECQCEVDGKWISTYSLPG
jgi:T5orf172 domain